MPITDDYIIDLYEDLLNVFEDVDLALGYVSALTGLNTLEIIRILSKELGE